MAALISLSAAGLIERDSNSDVLWTWSYPSISQEQRQLIERKGCLDSDNSLLIPFVYWQCNRQWFYVHTQDVSESANLPKVQRFSLVLITKDFNPEKYQTLCSILCQVYQTTGNPAKLLEQYLSVVTKGSCQSEENGTFVVQEFDQKRAYAGGSIKELISKFGIESILIYTGMLLKKKIVVYANDVTLLLKCIRSIPALVWHRQNWSLLYPYVHLSDDELQDLKATSSYVAGFTDAVVEGKTHLYDVFINMVTEEINVANHAKETFAMSKLHKDIAQAMVKCAQDDDVSDQQTIKEISNKTSELINNLKSLAVAPEEGGEPQITIELLKERKLQTSTENFLFNLAVAEGLVQNLYS
ncbi:DENN domain-containing protein 10-like [Amphiura filiformis]|uniref:DENN domain-containing protein 10-like n=1 Tax=Amphiura filiformis TaxID=82378 RepID=UPI003B2255C0